MGLDYCCAALVSEAIEYIVGDHICCLVILEGVLVLVLKC